MGLIPQSHDAPAERPSRKLWLVAGMVSCAAGLSMMFNGWTEQFALRVASIAAVTFGALALVRGLAHEIGITPAGLSRAKSLFVLAAGSVFAAGGVWMIFQGRRDGWLVFAFFGMCVVTALVMDPSGAVRLPLGGRAASGADAEQVLSQFPGPVTLQSSRVKMLVLLMGSVVFAVGGLAMISGGKPMGWLVLGFFGLCAIASAAMGVVGIRLTLDRDGFDITGPFRRDRRRWQDSGPFEVFVQSRGGAMVVFDSATGAAPKLVAMARKLTGHTGGLPNVFSLGADDLAGLMNAWRERALAGRSTAGGRTV